MLKVSIIIPVFNRADLISETILSVIHQSFLNWELLVIDDHSTDNTREIVELFVKFDSRISYYLRPDNLPRGANSCRNYGFSKAKGPLIKWLDSDDLLKPNCLFDQSMKFQTNSRILVCLGYGKFFDANSKVVQEDWSRNFESNFYFSDHIRNLIRWPVCGILWHKSVFKDYPFNNSLKNSQEWLMHSQQLLKLNVNHIFNFKDTVCLVRRGHFRMSSSKSYVYYFNQLKARYLLILFSFQHFSRIRLLDIFELVKQILVYFYYTVTVFFKTIF